MKRPSLVCYSSSEDEDASSTPTECRPPAKKRKLPPLPETIAPSPPLDNPSLHQGRIRTTPHVDGQFAAHIYISLKTNSALGKLLERVLDDTKKEVPNLQEFAGVGCREMHVSLSRPVYLRAHQREGLKVAMRNVARVRAPFTISFAALSVLVNDEKTRAFLTMEIGAGHNELRTLSDAFTPALTSIRQKAYYDSPRFHASIAWALLVTESQTSKDDFPKIEQMPEELCPFLNDKYQTSLASSTFEVADICVKIGKEVSTFRLNGD